LQAPDVFVAGHGVVEVTASFDSINPSELEGLRDWAESTGGAMVLLAAPDGFALDPWGAPPQTLDLQRRIKAGFDPAGVMAPGRLPGGL
jgi:FAD/FMN-containing dehydrogenase